MAEPVAPELFDATAPDRGHPDTVLDRLTQEQRNRYLSSLKTLLEGSQGLEWLRWLKDGKAMIAYAYWQFNDRNPVEHTYNQAHPDQPWQQSQTSGPKHESPPTPVTPSDEPQTARPSGTGSPGSPINEPKQVWQILNTHLIKLAEVRSNRNVFTDEQFKQAKDNQGKVVYLLRGAIDPVNPTYSTNLSSNLNVTLVELRRAVERLLAENRVISNAVHRRRRKPESAVADWALFNAALHELGGRPDTLADFTYADYRKLDREKKTKIWEFLNGVTRRTGDTSALERNGKTLRMTADRLSTVAIQYMTRNSEMAAAFDTSYRRRKLDKTLYGVAGRESEEPFTSEILVGLSEEQRQNVCNFLAAAVSDQSEPDDEEVLKTLGWSVAILKKTAEEFLGRKQNALIRKAVNELQASSTTGPIDPGHATPAGAAFVADTHGTLPAPFNRELNRLGGRVGGDGDAPFTEDLFKELKPNLQRQVLDFLTRVYLACRTSYTALSADSKKKIMAMQLSSDDLKACLKTVCASKVIAIQLHAHDPYKQAQDAAKEFKKPQPFGTAPQTSGKPQQGAASSRHRAQHLVMVSKAVTTWANRNPLGRTKLENAAREISKRGWPQAAGVETLVVDGTRMCVIEVGDDRIVGLPDGQGAAFVAVYDHGKGAKKKVTGTKVPAYEK